MEDQVEVWIKWCIFTTTLVDGKIPAERGEDDNPVVYETETEAQKEIALVMIDQLSEFLAGEREFDDAITTEDFVERVTLLADGSIVDKEGRHFAKGNW